MKPISLLVAAVVALAGCTMAPRYERPAAPAPAAWPKGPAYPEPAATPAGPAVAAADIGWREFFIEPRLAKLLELALSNNRDLRVAVLNVELSRPSTASSARLCCRPSAAMQWALANAFRLA